MCIDWAPMGAQDGVLDYWFAHVACGVSIHMPEQADIRSVGVDAQSRVDKKVLLHANPMARCVWVGPSIGDALPTCHEPGIFFTTHFSRSAFAKPNLFIVDRYARPACCTAFALVTRNNRSFRAAWLTMQSYGILQEIDGQVWCVRMDRTRNRKLMDSIRYAVSVTAKPRPIHTKC